ncbi:PREDICTED: monocarboxylate transporter 6-like [Priapulus caudatus]|uniref:Monocarboxylate transporter 6-like n=1 Tax=Priapulus caudatus TaxID=37621 RepID=A0ABM1EZS8_PRICU|nr:PREDICTED: monocarboxylate transporter 6-like [Priapulus caudatus]
MATGIISLMFLRSEELWVFALCCVLYGCSDGIRMSIQTPILVDLFGVQNLPMVQAIYNLFTGIGLLCGPVVAGFLLDYTGDMRAVFILCGVTCMVGTALQGGAFYIDYRQEHTREEPRQLTRTEIGKTFWMKHDFNQCITR